MENSSLSLHSSSKTIHYQIESSSYSMRLLPTKVRLWSPQCAQLTHSFFPFYKPIHLWLPNVVLQLSANIIWFRYSGFPPIQFHFDVKYDIFTKPRKIWSNFHDDATTRKLRKAGSHPLSPKSKISDDATTFSLHHRYSLRTFHDRWMNFNFEQSVIFLISKNIVECHCF